jgi:hypothetical protein
MPYANPEYFESLPNYEAGGTGANINDNTADPFPFQFSITSPAQQGTDVPAMDAQFQALIDWIDSSPDFSISGSGSKTITRTSWVGITITP